MLIKSMMSNIPAYWACLVSVFCFVFFKLVFRCFEKLLSRTVF
jgi:hypothetical protein